MTGCPECGVTVGLLLAAEAATAKRFPHLAERLATIRAGLPATDAVCVPDGLAAPKAYPWPPQTVKEAHSAGKEQP